MKFCTFSKGKMVVTDMIAICEFLVKLLMTVSLLTKVFKVRLSYGTTIKTCPITFKRDWISVWWILDGNLNLIKHGSFIEIFSGPIIKLPTYFLISLRRINQYVVGYGNQHFTFQPLWHTNDGCKDVLFLS